AVEIAVERRGSRGVVAVVRDVRSRGQANGTGEAPHAVAVALGFGGAKVPHHFPGSRVDDPRGRGPGVALFVGSPVPEIAVVLAAVVALALAARLASDGFDGQRLRRGEHE